MDTLTRALRIYDKMVQQDLSGERPLYRPKNWNLAARQKEKKKKKYDWSTKGGYIAPIFVPPTPNSELANSLKTIAESEAESGVNFKIIETGGISLKSILQRSNPLETAGCESEDCLPCKPGRGEGGQCEGCGINYKIECQLCPEGGRGVYIGETSRNLYTRSKEHLKNYEARMPSSFILTHQNSKHGGAEPDFRATVTARTKDCLTRQVRETVLIRRST